MRETSYDLRGLRFAALEWGSPVGIPTVLVHGWLDHAGSWERVAEGLEGWIVAPDLRGHGRSPWIGPGETYHVAEYVADLDALVVALGGRVRLVGHSLGGAITTYYAGARPQRVVALAVVDGIGLPDGGARARDRLVEFLDGAVNWRVPRPMASLDEAARRVRAARSTIDDAWARRLAERGTRVVPAGVAWAWDPRHRIRAAATYRQDQHLQLLRAIPCPVLSVHPGSSLFDAADVAALEAAIPDLRVVTLPGVGHMVPLEAPVALAAVLVPFLSGASPSSP